MGWSFSCDVNYTIADQLADFRKPGRYSAGYTLLRSVRVGNNHWALLEMANGHHVIALDLMKGPSKKHGEGAGYKGIDEMWGPVEVNCPLSILDNARAPENQFAYEWRKKVRAYHEAKKAKKKAIEPGTVVEYGGIKYRLESPRGPRKGWNVTRLDQPGSAYRMRANQIATARVIGEEICEQPATA
jgi:hypothetical protein